MFSRLFHNHPGIVRSISVTDPPVVEPSEYRLFVQSRLNGAGSMAGRIYSDEGRNIPLFFSGRPQGGVAGNVRFRNPRPYLDRVTQPMTDQQALAEFAKSRSAEAFALLVQRYVDLVYSTSCRVARDAHLAEDATQAVFIVLARKAKSINPNHLAGWLVNTSRLASRDAIRTRNRQQKRDVEAAHMRSEIQSNEEPTAEQISPLLDDALARLGNADRSAVVMRFLQGRSFSDVGQALGISDEAARKRVERAIERLRDCLCKSGVTPSIACLAVLLAAHQAKAAPIALVSQAAALVSSPAVGAAASIAKTVFWSTSMAKAPFAVLAILLSVLVVGGAVIGVVHLERRIASGLSPEPHELVASSRTPAAITLPNIDTSPIDPATAMANVRVTPDNWREVLVRLDNIYTDPIVLRLRNGVLSDFTALMENSDKAPVWASRDAVRKEAVGFLDAGELHFRDLLNPRSPVSHDEAEVALIELEWMAGENKAAVAAAIPMTKRLPPGPLRDQVYYYLIQSCSGSLDAQGSLKHLAEFQKLNAEASNRFFGPMPPLGLLRYMAFQYGNAQSDDDGALMLAGTPSAIMSASLRDQARKAAADSYKMFGNIGVPLSPATVPASSPASTEKRN